MLRRFVLALWLVCAACLAAVHADPREVESAEFKDDFGDEYDDRLARAGDLDQRFVFELEHNVPSAAAASSGAAAPFSPRGKVEVVFSSSSAKPKVTFLDTPVLGAAEIAHLEKLLRAGKHYTVRARSDPVNPRSAFVMTSIPMCMLAGTRMREDLTLHLSDTGKLVAIEYLTPHVSEASCLEFQKRDLKNAKLAPQAAILKAQNGPAPPKQVAPKKKAAPKGVKKPVQSEEGEPAPEENQSFLRRYWYIIVPLVVMSLFGGDPGPQGGAAGGAGGGGGAPAAGGGGGARRR